MKIPLKIFNNIIKKTKKIKKNKKSTKKLKIKIN